MPRNWSLTKIHSVSLPQPPGSPRQPLQGFSPILTRKSVGVDSLGRT